ncbi:MAG: DbpA RNA binding domain-containing protein, partial [Muribaculaceae bacterium]|nr:DbpA RNA binding domain-containing protein [Muribaculaceae bacterium]
LFFNAGKREKISRGDIAGFLMQQSGLKPDQVGKINIKDHWAIAAIPADKVKSVLENLKGKKLKNKSIRVSTIHNA